MAESPHPVTPDAQDQEDRAAPVLSNVAKDWRGPLVAAPQEAPLPWGDAEEKERTAALARAKLQRLVRRGAPWTAVAAAAAAVLVMHRRIGQVLGGLFRTQSTPIIQAPRHPVALSWGWVPRVDGLSVRVEGLIVAGMVAVMLVPGQRTVRGLYLLVLVIGAMALWHVLQPMVGAAGQAIAAV